MERSTSVINHRSFVRAPLAHSNEEQGPTRLGTPRPGNYNHAYVVFYELGVIVGCFEKGPVINYK